MIHQSLSEFISAPLQGAIPEASKPITVFQAQGVIDDLQTGLAFVRQAHETAQSLNLKDSEYESWSDICDALHYCESAIDALNEINENA